MSEPPLVLLHAFPLDHRLWQRQAVDLAAAGWRVLVPDLPGFGGTELPDAAPSLDAVAGLVLADLGDRGIDRCVLGGSSLGGYVAMAMLRARPQVAVAVMLCGTKATADGQEARANRERMARLVLDSPDSCARILESSFLPGLLGATTHAARPHVVAEVRGWMADARAETVAWYQRAMAARPDSRAVLESLAVPGLVVWGDEDAISPRSEQDLILESLAAPQLAVIEGAGHLACVEDPDAVTSTIRRFAESVTGPLSA